DSFSQLGYVMIGIAAANDLGVTGAVFHSINVVIYASGLFLVQNALKKYSGSSDLDNMGGLAKAMPWSFAIALVLALSMSGLPPFNGFASKYLIYQGLINAMLAEGSLLAIAALAALIFGSALTLASLLKILHAAFFSAARNQTAKPQEKFLPSHLLPVALAAACLFLGLYAFRLPIPLIESALNYPVSAVISVRWRPLIAFFLIAAGFALAAVKYFVFFKKSAVRRDTPFVGGENLDPSIFSSGTDFYQTLREIPVLKLFIKQDKK
ncbi:MAG TPA: hypothetical protein DEE98_03135, partial [Elusimicrobia bacterium]|nr:hypothetical protein [Elusimicrobiota bacterium]